MSGIGEALAIIGAAAALVTACKDGGSIARQIAKRRKKTGEAPPTELLQKSLDKGQSEITAKIEEGSDRFGVSFKNGDNVAVQALKDVTIEMQAALIRHLVVALEDESQIDIEFLTCEGSVTKARLRAINILNDLYQRQYNESMAQNGEKRSENGGTHSQSTGLEMPPLPSGPPVRASTNLSTATTLAPAQTPQKKSRRLLSRQSRRSTSDSIALPPSSISPTPEKASQLPTAAHMERVQTLPERTAPFDPGFTGSRRSTFSSNVEGRSTFTSNTLLPISRRSTVASTSSSFSDGLSIFCEGAHYVQASLDNKVFKLGFKLRHAKAARGSVADYWACQGSKCRVEGIARMDDYGVWQYDDTIRWSMHGIGYRWLFLAKSHIKSTSDNWKRQSKCLICARGLNIESETYSSDDKLFAHIARRHCGRVVAGLLLRGPISFDHNTLFAGTQDTYDICFPNDCPEHPFSEDLTEPPPTFSQDFSTSVPSPTPAAVELIPVSAPSTHTPIDTIHTREEEPNPHMTEAEELFEKPW